MAVRPAEIIWQQRGVARATWTGLLNGDTGAVADMPNLSDKTVQVFGTFGVGGSVTIQSTNDGGVTFFTATDPQGNALTFTAAGGEAILENAGGIRPNVTAGDGTTTLTVIVIAQSGRR